MLSAAAPELSIVVATRNRAAFLPELLHSLEIALAAAPIPAEIVIVDNGSTDATARVAREWLERLPGLVYLLEAQPGKSRALNRGLAVTRAPLLAFVDDDVCVAADWIQAVLDFFAHHPEYDAGGGRVRLARDVTDPELLARVAGYRSLPLYDGGDDVHDLRGLAGCNMAVRRPVVDIVGLFNERLGPGASGAHEDADYSERIHAANLTIGYMPGAIVYHAVDPARFTPASFRDFQQRMARSLYALDPLHAWRKSAGRLPGILIAFLWWSLLRNPTRRTRQLGRLIQHSEVLRQRWHDGWTPRAPAVDWPALKRKT